MFLFVQNSLNMSIDEILNSLLENANFLARSTYVPTMFKVDTL